MEQELQFIQNQLWFLIALFFLILATNIVCYFVRKGENSSDPDFSELWVKDQLDKLIRESREYLIKYPNSVDALYFGSKALVAKREGLPEAKMHLTKLLEIEPTLSKQIQEVIDEISRIEGS